MLISQLEAEFQVLFPSAGIQELTSFGRIVTALMDRLNG